MADAARSALENVLPPSSVSELVTACTAWGADVTALLQCLVQTPSVNGEETEAAVAEKLVEVARTLDLEAALIARDPARPNAVVRWGHGPARFVLVGHMDTVAAGDPSAWLCPPFAGEMRDGRMLGRGTADNKAGLACGLYTLAALREHGLLDPSDVQIVLVGAVDEESGATSRLGVRYLLDEGMLRPAKGAIYTYASDFVCVGHRGLLRLILRAEGAAVHSGSSTWARGAGGVNAVAGLADVVLRLESLEIPAPSHPAFRDLACTLTPGTLFRGGEYESMVPARAEALVDIRLMPGQSSEDVRARIDDVIRAVMAERSGLSVSMRVKNDLPGAAIPMDHPLALLAQHYARAITGQPWPIAGAGPANEGYMLIDAGIPTLCGFGPTGGNAHAPDEWVDLDSLSHTLAIYTATIEDYLGKV
jgi:acetylornithine deacetylase/succinyl-diaminopimelate desuccinylase-like protein